MAKTKGNNWISHARLVLNLIMKAGLTDCKVLWISKLQWNPALRHLLQTPVITNSFLGLAPYIFLKLTHLIRTLSNTDTSWFQRYLIMGLTVVFIHMQTKLIFIWKALQWLVSRCARGVPVVGLGLCGALRVIGQQTCTQVRVQKSLHLGRPWG